MPLVDTIKTIDTVQTFHPEFTHQIFGEQESIYGYKKPMIKIYYGGPLMRTYIAFEYEDILRSASNSGKPVQEVVEILSKYMAKGEIIIHAIRQICHVEEPQLTHVSTLI